MKGYFYRELGIKSDASADEIRAAFRKRAKETHPDCGGHPDQFAAVERAYRFLSDPETRKRYDETGFVNEPLPDNAEAAALGIIGNMLVSIIGSQNTGDPLVAMRQSLKQNIEQATRTIVELEQSTMRCEKLSARFKTKHERDPIKGMIGSQIANMRLQIENHRQAIATMERAQAILKDYEFAAEQAPDQAWAQMQMLTREDIVAQCAQQAGWRGW